MLGGDAVGWDGMRCDGKRGEGDEKGRKRDVRCAALHIVRAPDDRISDGPVRVMRCTSYRAARPMAILCYVE